VGGNRKKPTFAQLYDPHNSTMYTQVTNPCCLIVNSNISHTVYVNQEEHKHYWKPSV